MSRPGAIVALLAALVLVDGVLFGSRAAGGADSYGYISQAHLWLDGLPVQSLAWAETMPWVEGPHTFGPIGYVVTGTSTLVPLYSPGLPLLMALAIVVGGACAVFAVAPILGALTVVLTYVLGRQLVSPWSGVAAAWLVATSPVFLYMVVQPMSDVPVTAIWLAAWVLAWRGTPRAALGAGVLSGLAVLVRINLAPLSAAFVFWLAAKAWQDRADAGGSAGRAVAGYLLGLFPGLGAAFGSNWVYYGSPFRSGYGRNALLFQIENVLPNAGRYAEWLTSAGTPFVWVGVAALIVPLAWIWPRRRDRLFAGAAAIFVAILTIQYLLYSVFDAWWYLRFLLPGLPFVCIGIAAVAARAGGRSRMVRAVMVAGIVALGIHGIVFASRHWAFGLRQADARIVAAARVVRAVTEPESVIFSRQHSGSLRYYAGRMTIRYDAMPIESLDDSIRWLAGRGVHPYALLEDWEADFWRRHFGGRQHYGSLPIRPIRVMDGGITLYDLLSPGPDVPRRVSVSTGDFACQPAAPADGLERVITRLSEAR
jgi:hypothetical protein